MNAETFRKLALSLPDTVELPHFDRTSFRVKGKIFATLSENTGIACLMLSVVDQSVFCAYDKTMIYPVENKWGLKGATWVNLKKVRKDLLKDALEQAYRKAAEKKIARKKQ